MIFKRMREQILDKAIRGQLVPQLAEDGVVDQIGEAPAEVPFDIPGSWKWIKIPDVLLFQEGPGIMKVDFKNEGIPLIRISGMHSKFISLDGCNYLDPQKVAQKWNHFRLELGDVVISSSASLDKVAKVGEDAVGCIPYTGLIRFKSMGLVDLDFFAFFVKTECFIDQINSLKTGSTIKHFGPTHLKKMYIPLPPISEQKRIAAKIESLFDEIERAEKAYEELQSLANVLRGQILQKAIQGKLVPQLAEDGVVNQIGDAPAEVPFDIPDSWKWLTLEAIGFWKAGATPSRSVKEYYENGTIPWLKTGDLTDGIISTVEEQITQDALDSCTAHINPKGSVLIAMYGATIGKLGVLDIDCATNQACCACQINSSLIYNWYLFYYLMSQRANFIAQGAGGAQTNISKTKITVYPIPLPPLAEQKRIVAKIEALFEQIDLMTK
ncbi:restriction endonuclease subunit S [Anaerobiospirillum succiniciproducens]|uniref:restriction endonuclease subunit S n=1 Tax=Anaerobiospirillum succiniciproducens TaxID=13335 RepID=UPI003F8997AD